MTRYSKAILIFGLLVPMLLLLLGLVALFQGRKRITSREVDKDLHFQTHVEATREARLIEDWLAQEGRVERLEGWQAQLQEEFISSLTRHLEEVTAPFSEIQLTRTELSRPSGAGPVAGATKNRHSRLKLSFEGGMAALQPALAELEIRMPQLLLESLQVNPQRSPGAGAGMTLKVDVTYLCWQDFDVKR